VRWGGRENDRQKDREGRNKRKKQTREFQCNVIVLITSGGGYMYIHNTRTLSEGTKPVNVV
jgi:hypothetical protein